MRIKSISKVILNEPKTYYDVINANPYNNFLIKTSSSTIVSHNCFTDEISFIPTQDVNKQKEKAKNLVNTAAVRMQSRFMKGEYNPTILVLASSKRTEQSFMEEFIAERKRRESKTTLIIDEPQWVIRTDKDSPNKFKVAIGNKFLSSEVLPLDVTEDTLKNMRDQGYQILEVPMGYYDSFIEDIDVALTDIAGVSTSSSNRYFSGPRVAATKTDSYKNAFIREIIEVGNAPDDTTQYWDYFDLSRITPDLKNKPLFVHYDMSISGDKTGLAGTFIWGKKPPKEGEPPANDLIFKLGFHVSIKAPKGYQVSFEKNRQFIYWLRERGFRVRGTSSDTFQSAEFGQAMTAKNYNYKVISVDRVEPSSHICRPYQFLRGAMYENRFIMYENEHLTEEILGLERDNNSGKLDHSTSGINSKDSADAVCGSVWHASQYADEFAYDYGEIIDTTVDINKSSDDIKNEQEEFNKDMAKSLLLKLNKNNNSNNKNNHLPDLDQLDYEIDDILSGYDDIII